MIDLFMNLGVNFSKISEHLCKSLQTCVLFCRRKSRFLVLKWIKTLGKRGIKMGPLSISEQYISIQTKVDPPSSGIFGLRLVSTQGNVISYASLY